jgi:hypothetical protein
MAASRERVRRSLVLFAVVVKDEMRRPFDFVERAERDSANGDRMLTL